MDIYNASMIQGYVPEPLERSDEVPVPKCSLPKSVEQDLRPISLMSHLVKIMEGFTLSTLLNQVCDKLDAYQFALAGKLTTHALAYFLHALLQSLDHGDVFARVFFADVSKGFNLVDHSMLVQELQFLGVNEASIRWISSFLSGRAQQFLLDGISPRGGIPQGTRLAPLLFAILVNNLCREWHNRLIYIDDTSVFEVIPGLSPSYFPFIAADINSFASERNMKVNEKNCKDMVISFLKYQPTVVSPRQLNGAVIERVPKYKLLRVIILQDLTWNEHCDHIHNKALKQLYALRSLKKAGLNCDDLVLVYCSLLRSIIEYASPVWAALPSYLWIIFGKPEYADAMAMTSLDTLKARRVAACQRFILNARQHPPLMDVIPSPTYHECECFLRSRNMRPVLGRTNRLNDFVIVK